MPLYNRTQIVQSRRVSISRNLGMGPMELFNLRGDSYLALFLYFTISSPFGCPFFAKLVINSHPPSHGRRTPYSTQPLAK